MTKLKVFSLLPALLLASIVQAWEVPEIRELSAAEIQPKHESLQPHKSLVAQLDPTFGIRACLFRGPVPPLLLHQEYLLEKETLRQAEGCLYPTLQQKLSSFCVVLLES